MKYKQAIEYIESLIPKDFNPELGPIIEACRIFDEPGFAYPTVHIAGTNGKGSTASFISSIFTHSGYNVGMYTSPHLVDTRERIQVNGKMISEKDFARLTDLIRSKLTKEIHLTYFEFLTLISFLYFREKKVDLAVFETGMGGRLDATNVILPGVVVITPISIDHSHHLGNSLAEIANEKCGIIKRGVPTVVAEQEKEVMDVIRRWCDEMGSPLCVASARDITQPLGMEGLHQRQNASCAIEAAELLSGTKFKIKNLNKALLETKWAGRIETVNNSPRIILDGAHNPGGAKVLADYITSNINKEEAVMLLGIFADKDIKEICRLLVPTVREIVCIRAPSERAASPKDIAAVARSFGAKVYCEENLSDSIKKWMGKIKPSDTLIITGSLSVVGEARRYFKK